MQLKLGQVGATGNVKEEAAVTVSNMLVLEVGEKLNGFLSAPLSPFHISQFEGAGSLTLYFKLKIAWEPEDSLKYMFQWLLPKPCSNCTGTSFAICQTVSLPPPSLPRADLRTYLLISALPYCVKEAQDWQRNHSFKIPNLLH